MRIPSIKTLTTIAGNRAGELRKVLQADKPTILDWLESGQYPQTARWVSQCYNYPREHELRFAVANEILGTHGVEYIQKGRNSKSPAIEYCNTGDTYDATLLFMNGNFRVGCWGDTVERGNYD